MEIARTLSLVADRASARLDLHICQSCNELSRSSVQKLISSGYITVNGMMARPSSKVKAGDVVVINVPVPEPSPALVAEQIPLNILYEDNDILVIDKPAGIAVYPAPGHPSHTLMNAVLAHCPDISRIDGSVRPGIVHRLDKDTSGVMVVAKSKMAQLNLSAQLKGRRVLKKYLVLVKGYPSPEQGVIEAPIGRHPRDRKRMAVVSGGREARTAYRVTKRFSGYSLVEVTLLTGRTHQIRVHFSRMGWPVAGDAVYGVKTPYLERQFVHASRLGFHLPSGGEWSEFSSKLPQDLEEALEQVPRL
ncbi:MAG: pseudouridine synthase [Chloroflexi bacterium RBG_13_53_26]|nr:MAG: pseudouridine synthase [Chloroflexi bacterium RBG_13_53_26]